MTLCGKSLPPGVAALFTSDLLTFTVAVPLVMGAPAFTFSAPMLPLEWLMLVARLVGVAMLCMLVFYCSGLYDLRVVRKSRDLAVSLLQGTAILVLLLAVLSLLMFGLKTGLGGTLMLIPMLLVAGYLPRRLALPGKCERVLVVGSGVKATELLDVIAASPEWNMEVAQVIWSCNSMQAMRELEYGFGLGLTDIDRVVVCADTAKDSALLNLLMTWKVRGVNIEDGPAFYERVLGRLHVDDLLPDWFVFSTGFEYGSRMRSAKRYLDIAVALLLLLPALPLMVVTAIAILIEHKGPIFTRESRIGQGRREFSIYKFRTALPSGSLQETRGAVEQDVHRTKLGELLYTLWLDELPQLLNVLLGDMSLVGPRPEQPHICGLLADKIPYYRQRHTVLPGLTGWAQVKRSAGTSVEDSKCKFEFDLFYMKHVSLWFDLLILVETVKMVLARPGESRSARILARQAIDSAAASHTPVIAFNRRKGTPQHPAAGGAVARAVQGVNAARLDKKPAAATWSLAPVTVLPINTVRDASARTANR